MLKLPKETMSFTDELLENNKAYAASFSGPLPLPPAKNIAVLACMHESMFMVRWALKKVSHTLFVTPEAL